MRLFHVVFSSSFAIYSIKLSAIFLVACLALLPCLAQEKFHVQSHEALIRYIPLPKEITRADVLEANGKTRTLLHRHLTTQLKKMDTDSLAGRLDIIVIFTDINGDPILPDKDRLQQQKKENGKRVAGNEITLSFASPSQPWTAAEIKEFAVWQEDFYPMLKKLLGNPFFSMTLNVRKDASIPFSGLYNASINEMVLKSPGQDVFCHELIHAFRDDYIMGLSTYEEGMTRAAEVELFNQLPGYTHPFDHAHSYHYDYFYEGHNRPNIATVNGNVQANAALTLMRYQVSSYVWTKAYLENNDFFHRFQDSLFGRTVRDQTTRYTAGKLRSIVEEIIPAVEGVPVATWYNRQHVLNTGPVQGYKLYQRISQYTIDYFLQSSTGSEMPQGGATVSWQIFGYDDQLLSEGSGVSNAAFGWTNIIPKLPPTYQGRLRVVVSAESPYGPVVDTVYRTRQPNDEQGVFGLVADANSGTVRITPMDTPVSAFTATLVNGAFSIPELQEFRGRFRVQFTYPDGFAFTRVFTKDRSHYFLWMEKAHHHLQALPIRFSDFTVLCKENKTSLTWSATIDGHAGLFEVQKKNSSALWEVAHQVNVVVNGQAIQQFQFDDNGGAAALYRVAFVDASGKKTYTAIQTAHCDKGPVGLALYPVPAGHVLNVVVTWQQQQEAVWQICDMAGRVLQKKKVTLQKTKNELSINSNFLPAGEYIFKIQAGTRIKTAFFLKR